MRFGTRFSILITSMSLFVYWTLAAQDSPHTPKDKKHLFHPLPQDTLWIELTSVDPPHWGDAITCQSCHITHHSAGAAITTAPGNANLCMSCHNPVGLASVKPFSESDKAIPGMVGTSHAWEVAADNPTYGASPPTNEEMALRVMDGRIVCSTCHDQHSQTYPPFLRMPNVGDAICKDCHRAWNIGTYRSNPSNIGSHPVGIDYPESDDRFHYPTTNPVLVLPDGKAECTTCHSPHYADSGGANGGLGDRFILNAANDNSLCQSCHTYEDHQGQGCLTCHQPHDPSRQNIFIVKDTITTPSSDERRVRFLAESGPSSFADGDATYDGVCEICHTTTLYHRNNDSGDHTHFVGQNCVQKCHRHKNSFHPPGCMECHGGLADVDDWIFDNGLKAMISISEWTSTGHGRNNGTYASGNPAANEDCDACHTTSVKHGDSTNPMRLKSPTNSVCLSCHGDANLATGIDVDEAHNGYRHDQPTAGGNFCWDCHDPHGDSNNIYMVHNYVSQISDGTFGIPITAVALSFTANNTGTDYARSTSPYDGICQVCHTTTNHYTFNSGDRHNENIRCTACHPHRAKFAPRGGCVDCHNQPQGIRRQVVDSNKDGSGSGGDFIRTSHHVQPVVGTVSNDDCVVCHDISGHMAGTVELNDADGGSPFIFTGSGANIKQFCLNCHDADADVPFTDGIVVKEINASAWAAASHKFEEITCYGDGANGCHQNGHGSENEKILAPFDNPLPGEEVFCYRCHSNQQQKFSYTPEGVISHHRVENGAEWRVECTNCHNPHVSQEDPRAAVNPDNIDQLFTFPSSVYTIKTTAYNSFCLSCHDGDPPLGVKGAIDIQAELKKQRVMNSLFVKTTHKKKQTKNLHFKHFRRGFGCQNCHVDVHGTQGNSGIQRGRLLGDFLTINQFDNGYKNRASCSTGDPWGRRCH